MTPQPRHRAGWRLGEFESARTRAPVVEDFIRGRDQHPACGATHSAHTSRRTRSTNDKPTAADAEFEKKLPSCRTVPGRRGSPANRRRRQTAAAPATPPLSDANIPTGGSTGKPSGAVLGAVVGSSKYANPDPGVAPRGPRSAVESARVARAVEASPRTSSSRGRQFGNAHAYHINSLSVNSDCETYISADDLRVNLWHLERGDAADAFTVVDIKPENMEDLTEVITSAEFHPSRCDLFAYSSSKGSIRLADMRTNALCASSAKTFDAPETPGSRSFFSEISASVSDVKFTRDGGFLLSRDYLNMRLWDLRMENRPVATFEVHEHLRAKLCDLYESDAIFDKFQCCRATRARRHRIVREPIQILRRRDGGVGRVRGDERSAAVTARAAVLENGKGFRKRHLEQRFASVRLEFAAFVTEARRRGDCRRRAGQSARRLSRSSTPRFCTWRGTPRSASWRARRPTRCIFSTPETYHTRDTRTIRRYRSFFKWR